MPFLIPIAIALGGLFVGSQVDNAVQAAASKPAIIDDSKAPWWVQYAIIGVVALILWHVVGKKLLK